MCGLSACLCENFLNDFLKNKMIFARKYTNYHM